MERSHWWAIKIGAIVLFLIIRWVYRSSNSKPSELSISSTLEVDSTLLSKLNMQPGEQVALSNRPDTFEVVVSAKGADRYEEIGVIEDRELAEKVRNNTARGKVEYTYATGVRLTLTY